MGIGKKSNVTLTKQLSKFKMLKKISAVNSRYLWKTCNICFTECTAACRGGTFEVQKCDEVKKQAKSCSGKYRNVTRSRNKPNHAVVSTEM